MLRVRVGFPVVDAQQRVPTVFTPFRIAQVGHAKNSDRPPSIPQATDVFRRFVRGAVQCLRVGRSDVPTLPLRKLLPGKGQGDGNGRSSDLALLALAESVRGKDRGIDQARVSRSCDCLRGTAFEAHPDRVLQLLL